MLHALVMPTAEVSSIVSVRPYSVGQDVPTIKKMLVRDKLEEGIQAIKMSEDIDLLAYWPDYGYATFDQLDAMASIHEARNNFDLVKRTLAWLESVEWRVADIREPFQDTSGIPKYKGYVQTLNLAINKIPGEMVAGAQLMDFRQDLWLHTTSLLVSLFALRAEHPDVGVVHPSFHQFALPEQKRRVAGGCGASDPKFKRVVGVLNTDLHWVAFLIDRKNKVCYMFDPLQSDANYKIIEKSVRQAVEGLLDGGSKLLYGRISWCKQQDFTSCGIWCLAVLEMLITDSKWDDCLYWVVPYLRMRYLYKAIAFIEKMAIMANE
ncbi:unnamed protein product [Phytophthora fragariaefolia]|uniref:Unnamed protein product n=1 Tax=Phytophthora fragariaefolia TaxID=1490495 RepID=A0A9W6Y5Q0_9STRA|nr:unnamed protein product [Phytophthora fragariaefolia]